MRREQIWSDGISAPCARIHIYIRAMQAPTRATPALASYEQATSIYASSEALICAPKLAISHTGAATLRSFVTRPTGGRVIFWGKLSSQPRGKPVRTFVRTSRKPISRNGAATRTFVRTPQATKQIKERHFSRSIRKKQ